MAGRMVPDLRLGMAASVKIPPGPPGLATFLKVLGPAYLVAVGYMDPGNWATDLAAGSTSGYALLWVVAFSSAMAMVAWTWPRPVASCCRLAGACPFGSLPKWP